MQPEQRDGGVVVNHFDGENPGEVLSVQNNTRAASEQGNRSAAMMVNHFGGNYSVKVADSGVAVGIHTQINDGTVRVVNIF